MEKILERVLTDIFKGIIYSVLFAVVGLGLSLIKGWPLLKGSYVLVLIAGTVVMVVSIMLLVGTPKMRKQFILKGKFINGRIEKLDDEERRKDFSAYGVSPAIIAVVMIIIGFLIEALMH